MKEFRKHFSDINQKKIILKKHFSLGDFSIHPFLKTCSPEYYNKNTSVNGYCLQVLRDVYELKWKKEKKLKRTCH